jgi:hypothetical protein
MIHIHCKGRCHLLFPEDPHRYSHHKASGSYPLLTLSSKYRINACCFKDFSTLSTNSVVSVEVEACTSNTYSSSRRVCDGVDFGMKGSLTMALLKLAARFCTMGRSLWASVVSCREDSTLTHQYTTHASPRTTSPFRNRFSNSKEVFLPTNSRCGVAVVAGP